MNAKLAVTIAAVFVLLGQGCVQKGATQRVQNGATHPSAVARDVAPTEPTSNIMRLTSGAFEQGQSIPSKYTCDGQNINPPLAISGVPPSAKSLALIMDDPDVPAAAGVKVWDHWVVFNMPATVASIGESEQPEGVRGQGTRGSLSYGGPCPPDREHRYFFKLYALDAMLTLKEGATKAEVERAMQGHIIETTELMGRYVRK